MYMYVGGNLLSYLKENRSKITNAQDSEVCIYIMIFDL